MLKFFRRMTLLLFLLVMLLGSNISANATTIFDQGFEIDTSGWDVFGGSFDATRVASGNNGITSASGGFHAEGATPATNWGGYSSVFPAFGYTTMVDIYLDMALGTNDLRFDWGTAINMPDGNHRRDFIFNAGFYNDNDGSPGSGSDRFIISASNNSQPSSAYAKNP